MQKSIGAIKSFQAEDQTLVLHCENGDVLIEVINHSIIKIHAAKSGENWRKFSYSVAKEPCIDFKIELKNFDDKIEFSTEKLHITIQKFPYSIEFFDLSHTIINADDKKLSIQIDGNEITNYKQLQNNEKFVGLGQKTFGLNKRGTQLSNWNSDQFGFHGETDPLYGSYPFYYGVTEKNFYGIFLDNSSKSVFNFGASNHRFSFFNVNKGQLKYYFIYDDSPAQILSHFCDLTGKASLPPIWALGYQQCRYSYYPEHEMRLLAQNFLLRKIPCDVLYYDIHYMKDYKVFTWDKERFPEPEKLNDELKKQGFRTVAIVDPGVKIEEGYEVYETGKEGKHFITYIDGENYSGDAWPGTCHFPDFTKADTRKWWSEYVKKLINEGISGIWNDMNEPAVWGKNFPDITVFDYDSEIVSHKTAHNVYGMQMARSSFEAQQNERERPFVLTRAGFAGVQRFSAVWTGDNVSSEDQIGLGQHLVNNLGLTGVAFTGNDIGGFIGEAWPDLFARWIALGAFNPFYRGHSMVNSRDAEPWSFGEETEDVSRNYIRLRYKLLSYLYSAFYQHTQTGIPICRSLFLSHSRNSKTYLAAYQNQFFYGDAFLVCPINAHRGLHQVWLPPINDVYYDFYDDQILESDKEHIAHYNINKIPVFIKSGAILPVLPWAQNTASINWKTIEIHVYKGLGTFDWYLDDGLSSDYKNGLFCKQSISISIENDKYVLKFGKTEGLFKPEIAALKIYLHGFSSTDLANEYNSENYRWVEPVSNFDPYFGKTEDGLEIKNLKYFEHKWPKEAESIYL